VCVCVCSARAEAPPARAYPLRSRRTTRSSAHADGADAADEKADDAGDDDDDDEEEAPLSYVDDASVRRYACAASAPGARPFLAGGASASASASASSPPSSFAHVAALSFADPALTRVYAIDARAGLLAAAGHGGRAALWGIPCGEDEAEEEADADAEEEAPRAPLLSWRAHAGWVSGAALLSHAGATLLTTGNDGALCLWDVTQQHAGAPRRVATSSVLHRGGIWSLHVPLENGADTTTIWTASKDGSVVQSVVTPAGAITALRSFSGHHRGVVRAVRAAGASGGALAASGGADGGICLLDARVASGLVHSLTAAHPAGAAVNCLEWHPAASGAPHTLLSAGSDPVARLWDLRATSAAPLHELNGHCAPSSSKNQKLRHVYRPAFVARGAAVATPGEGSRALSLYCAASGRCISRGGVGFDATLAFCCGGGGDDGDVAAPLLLARPGGALSVYAPQWGGAE
jgi:hypothetical protein